MDWRTDFENAPKDGSDVDLLTSADGVPFRITDCRFLNGRWCDWEDGWGYQPIDARYIFTHWMVVELPQ